ncbi:hypothetical protein SAMN02910289_00610 [Lachnospiraceae bacterium RM5]|nr:hypothetical protein SAMN02910289_00610 [Lachnospiraceae bacterium RM5]
MLNEEKVKIMTKLAIYEKNEGKDAIKNNKYYKSDYVSIMLINTIITITFAYILGLVIVAIYKMDYFLENLVKINLMNLGMKVLAIYLIILIIYIVIAYIIYSMKYLKIMELNKKYSEDLKELYLVYKKEEKMKSEAKAGGFEINDTDVDI